MRRVGVRLNLATGTVIGSLPARHRAIEFKKFLTTIDREVTTKKPSAAPTAASGSPPRHPRLETDLERRPTTLRLDQDRRPDPRIHRPLLHTH